MQNKILSVFYADDRLPYKDASRTTHYPIASGDVFNGANNVTTIRFYVDRIGGTQNVQWVATSKLPNGQIGNEVLSVPQYDSDLGEYYLELSLSSYYTTLKGDLYIALNGYQGGIEIEEDEDTGIYSIYGTPTIQATGSIKIGINYAPQIIQGSHFNTSDLQQILGALGDKANVSDVILVVETLPSDLTGYDNGQLFFYKANNKLYYNNSGSLDEYIEFVDTSTNQIVAGQKTFSGKTIFSDPNLYNSRITTNSKNYFARVGVTTNQYVNYALPYSYSQVGNNTLSLAPKYTITLTNASGTLTGLDLTMVSDDTTVIIYNNETYRKYNVNNDLNAVFYRKTTKPSVSSGEITFDEGEIVIALNNGFYLASSLLTPITTYTKAKIDTIIENAIAGVKANEFQVVEELPQEGEEGIIYLVEVSSGVYQQYIWEGDDYIDLGTTQIDLSGYVPTSRTINNKALTSDITLTSSDIGSVPDTRTIAGLQLDSDITSQELTDALIFASDNDIDALF